MKRKITAVVILSAGLLLLGACSAKKVSTDKSSSVSNHSTKKSSQQSKVQESSHQITPRNETSRSSSTVTSKSNDTPATVPSSSQSSSQPSPNSSPYSVVLSPAHVPISFHFRGVNVPDSIVINDSNASTVTVVGKDGKSKVYNATNTTIATKQIRLFSAQNNLIRTVKVNTQITLNAGNPDTITNSGPLYLFHNSQGGISLATPNYAGNVPDNQRDVMQEVVQ